MIFHRDNKMCTPDPKPPSNLVFEKALEDMKVPML